MSYRQPHDTPCSLAQAASHTAVSYGPTPTAEQHQHVLLLPLESRLSGRLTGTQSCSAIRQLLQTPLSASQAHHRTTKKCPFTVYRKVPLSSCPQPTCDPQQRSLPTRSVNALQRWDPTFAEGRPGHVEATRADSSSTTGRRTDSRSGGSDRPHACESGAQHPPLHFGRR